MILITVEIIQVKHSQDVAVVQVDSPVRLPRHLNQYHWCSPDYFMSNGHCEKGGKKYSKMA